VRKILGHYVLDVGRGRHVASHNLGTRNFWARNIFGRREGQRLTLLCIS